MIEHWLAMLTGTLIMRKRPRQGLQGKGEGFGSGMPVVRAASRSEGKQTRKTSASRVPWPGFWTGSP